MTDSNVIPAIGFGTFRLKDQVAYDAVSSALEAGYRHVDTAQIYRNEEAVGRAIRNSGLPRQDVFLTTKVWFDRLDGDDLIRSLEESLDRLGTEQVDLALIHWPSPGDEVPIEQYIASLAEARSQGLTRHIGVSNFTCRHVDEALATPGGEHIVTNQIEVHPYLANRALVGHCQAKGLQVTGYMPLAVGKVMHDERLQRIASAHNATPAQVALAWVAARDIVVIPSSTRAENQRANLAAMDLQLSKDQLAAIDELDCGERIADPDFAPQWDS